MKFQYMWKDQVMTSVDATDPNNIKIQNHDDDPLKLAFGLNSQPKHSDLIKFFERRVITKYRANLTDYLYKLGIYFYDPIEIAKMTKGASQSDFHWILFEGENISYQDIIDFKKGKRSFRK